MYKGFVWSLLGGSCYALVSVFSFLGWAGIVMFNLMPGWAFCLVLLLAWGASIAGGYYMGKDQGQLEERDKQEERMGSKEKGVVEGLTADEITWKGVPLSECSKDELLEMCICSFKDFHRNRAIAKKLQEVSDAFNVVRSRE